MAQFGGYVEEFMVSIYNFGDSSSLDILPLLALVISVISVFLTVRGWRIQNEQARISRLEAALTDSGILRTRGFHEWHRICLRLDFVYDQSWDPNDEEPGSPEKDDQIYLVKAITRILSNLTPKSYRELLRPYTKGLSYDFYDLIATDSSCSLFYGAILKSLKDNSVWFFLIVDCKNRKVAAV